MHLRSVEPGEVPDFLAALGRAYGRVVDDGYLAAWDGAFDADRNLGLFDGGRLVGTATAGLVTLTTPGRVSTAAICTGNLTIDRRVAVPGLARQVFLRQCHQHRAAGYGLLVFSVTPRMRAMHMRTGSAPATAYAPVRLDSPRRIKSPVGGIGEASLFDPVLDAIHRRVAAQTPGMIVRDKGWMATVRRLMAADRSPAVWTHVGDGRPDGFAVWYRDPVAGHVVVEELEAEHPEAGRVLIRALLAEHGPVELRYWRTDDPIRWWPSGSPQVRREASRDALWVRIVDVPRALAARRYLGSGTVVLRVTDPLLPEAGGRFVLSVRSDGRGSCTLEPGDGFADATLSVRELGALYLGSVDVWTLVESGAIRLGPAPAGDRLAAIFARAQTPWSGSER